MCDPDDNESNASEAFFTSTSERQEDNEMKMINSDVQRVRELHTTSGYREGMFHGQASISQEAFDAGYRVGALIGNQVGCIIGMFSAIQVLEELALPKGPGKDFVISKDLRDAQAELTVKLVYDEFLAHHYLQIQPTVEKCIDNCELQRMINELPVLAKWTGKLKELMHEYGLGDAEYEELVNCVDMNEVDDGRKNENTRA